MPGTIQKQKHILKYRIMKRTIDNPVIRDQATFLLTSAESGGTCSKLEITLMPGGGNPLHYHKTYAETFFAVEGDLGLRTGRHETRILKPGESFTVEPMMLHSFFNPGSSQVRFRIEIRPGHEGFENSLRILYGMAGDGLTNRKSIPRSLVHTALIVCMSDMNAPGLLTVMYPLLKRIASTKKARAEEQRLLERYCA
jgi:mannose-6-phosphate isomerase-like protein (cupin superfamily)